MAREFHAILGGGNRDYISEILYLFGVICLSLSVLSIIIFSCGDEKNNQKHRKRRNGRGISGIGGDGGGDGGGGGSGYGGGGG